MINSFLNIQLSLYKFCFRSYVFLVYYHIYFNAQQNLTVNKIYSDKLIKDSPLSIHTC